jgi:hypothetical protein
MPVSGWVFSCSPPRARWDKWYAGSLTEPAHCGNLLIQSRTLSIIHVVQVGSRVISAYHTSKCILLTSFAGIHSPYVTGRNPVAHSYQLSQEDPTLHHLARRSTLRSRRLTSTDYNDRHERQLLGIHRDPPMDSSGSRNGHLGCIASGSGYGHYGHIEVHDEQVGWILRLPAEPSRWIKSLDGSSWQLECKSSTKQ